jgi:hypothetical protein
VVGFKAAAEFAGHLRDAFAAADRATALAEAR